MKSPSAVKAWGARMAGPFVCVGTDDRADAELATEEDRRLGQRSGWHATARHRRSGAGTRARSWDRSVGARSRPSAHDPPLDFALARPVPLGWAAGELIA